MAATAEKVKDPVCGMMIDPATAAAKRTYGGKDFYFKCEGARSPGPGNGFPGFSKSP